MKSTSVALLARGCLLVAMVFGLSERTQSLAAPTVPTISQIWLDGTNVVVSVSVPTGVKKVTLESRPRLGVGTWVPRLVSRTDGTGGEFTFQVPKTPQIEILRVRTDSEDALPASFYQGTNSFVAGTGAAGPANSTLPTAGAAVPGQDGAPIGAATTTRDVVESDIWKVDGDTLYFFNQYRGLQVVDLTVPDAPVITGTYPLPAAGEQMYLLDGAYVVLLAQSGCGSDSQVLILDAMGGVPKVVASLPVPGWIQESRLVGTALYVASQGSQPVPGSKDGSWEWGSTISSFDLSAPANPLPKDSLWYSGGNNVIYATDQYLFVAMQNWTNWWQSVLQCIDISAPDGSMKALSSITTAGNVPDKFKLNQNNDVLAVISENWNTQDGAITTLETFSLVDPTVPAKLGRLELARGEQLHASRFDGNHLYVVTFFQVDPLWIVDLSDPTAPRIAGELEVPGWSTYIQPLGDRLVAIGINNTNDWRVAVSLFDVHDPAQPALLSKVPLGVNYSWSEANNDEKAFAVLPDAGLILVPYQGYETNGYASRVQLIDLGPDSLTGRGTIDHAFQPRRATLHNNRVYSISGKELLAVDAADRDHPLVRADIELSWSVDQVLLVGEYLLEIANGNSWYGWWSQGSATPPSVRVVKTSNPDQALSTFVFTNYLPVAGATLRDGKLYVVQATGGYGPPILAGTDPNQAPNPTNPPSLFLSVLDVSALPAVMLAGQTAVVTDPLGWYPNLQPVWTGPGVLVWSGGGGGLYPFLSGTPIAGGVASGTGAGAAVIGGGGIGVGGIWRPWWGGAGGRLLAFDVSAPASPRFVSDLDLTTNQWWSFSSPYTANGLVYLSHQSSEFLEGVTVPGEVPPGPTVTVDPTTGQLVTNQPPIGIWVQRNYLDVVDYTDPTSPTLRTPVNIPGQLNGLSHGGALLYTVGPHWTNWMTDWNQWLDASAYDGVSASLVDSLALSNTWPHPLLVSDGDVFIGIPDSTTSTSQLQTWVVADTGKFTQIGNVQLGSTINTLAAFGNILSSVQQNNDLVLFDATNPASLVAIGKGQPQGCLGYDLTQGDASRTQGLWVPLGDYGILQVPTSP